MKNAFLINISIGYMGYKDDKIYLYNIKVKGNTVGVRYSMGYDIRLSESFMLGLQASLMLGSLKKYKLIYDNYTEVIKLGSDLYEDLSIVDFSIGLRFVK